MAPSNLWWYLHIYNWRDFIEIAFLSSAVYYCSLWLRNDYQKPLLFSLYVYCGLFFAAHYAQLYTVSSLLLAFAPVIIICFIVLHQDTLQRNFVMLHNITPSLTATGQWTETLVRSCLIAVSDNKEIRCLIEKKDLLSALVAAPFDFECPLSDGLLEMLINSNSFDSKKMIWLTSQGTLKGVNCSWKKNSVEAWLSQEVKEQEEWLQDALFFTAKTDALFFAINPTTRTYTLIAQGKILEQVSAHAALKSIKRYFGIIDKHEKGDLYAEHHKTSSSEQSLS